MPQQVVLRGVAVAGVSLTATAVVIGILLLIVFGVPLQDELGLRIVLFFALIGAGVITLVVAGVLSARWWALPRPVLVGVGGPLTAVALSSVLTGGGLGGLSLSEFDGQRFLTVVVALVVGDAVTAWAASGRGVRLIGMALTLVVLVSGAAVAEGPLDRRTRVDSYATLGVPLLVPDAAAGPLTKAQPFLHDLDDAPPSWRGRRGTIGVLAIETKTVFIRIEPLPDTELSCANLFDFSVRPGLDYSSESDICEQVSPDRWLVVFGITGRPSGLVALRPDALVAVELRDDWAADPADGIALMQQVVDSLVPTSPERLADLPQR